MVPGTPGSNRPLAPWFRRLLRPHPAERGRDLWFLEEARGERLANLLRIVFVAAWVFSTGLHAPGNHFWSNVSNLGVGGSWLLWALGVQVWLLFRPYHPKYKFVTTAMDMAAVTVMIWLYQYTAGPAYALKVPTFLNYFCALGLAGIRFKRSLAVWGGSLAVGLYLLLFLAFVARYDMAFGTNVEHTTSFKVSWHYVVFQLVFLVVFSYLMYIAAVNVRRLVVLRSRESEAAQKAQERASLAAGVAHEIKNPLEGIYGAAQLLQEEGKGNPRFVEMILKDAARLNDTVQEFLRFSRPFAAKPETFDLAAWTREFCRAQDEVVAESRLECAVEAEEFPIRSDPAGIRQILLNLVQNARRYQLPGRPVRVILEATDGMAEIAVEDEGSGVSEEARARLFEPFFTTSAKGTGLGLAISRKIARELGGDLYYEPREPGARFVLLVRPFGGTA